MDMIRTITLKGHNSRVTTRLRGVIPGCIQPETVKSLLDVENCLPYRDFTGVPAIYIEAFSYAGKYCRAINQYVTGTISYDEMVRTRNNAGKIRPVA